MAAGFVTGKRRLALDLGVFHREDTVKQDKLGSDCGGFDVVVDDGPEAARAFATERAGVLGAKN